MKVIGITSTAILSLLLGMSGPSYGQQEQQRGQEGQSEQQQSRHEQGRPEQQQGAERQQRHNQDRQQQQAQQQNQDRQQQNAQRQQEQNREQQQRGQWQGQNREQQQRGQWQDRDRQQQRGQQGSWAGQRREPVQRGHEREVWQQHRASNWQSEHRDWRQRGGYNGYRIPDNRFRSNFGRNHWFRIHRYPIELYGGYPRFQYGGYWFGLVDPWPEYWGEDWYDNDDVSIVYSDGGYYLYNRRYPGDRIAVTVYLR